MEGASVSERVRAYVVEKELSQKLIAKNMNISEGRLSLMLNGKRRMTVEDYLSLCNAMAVSPIKFLEQPN
jgi:transcriptional regulator with XRE-family HTH domain